MARPAKYVATRTIEHDGKPYPEGSELTLPDDAVAALLEVGAIVRKNPPADAQKGDDE